MPAQSHEPAVGAYVSLSPGRSVSRAPARATPSASPAVTQRSGSSNRLLTPRSKAAAMKAHLDSLGHQTWVRNLEKARRWYRQQYRLRREEEAEGGFREPADWTGSASRSKRKIWAPLTSAQSHEGSSNLRMTDACDAAAITALRMDLCYLMSSCGRRLPGWMNVGDPLEDLNWDMLLAAHVTITEEEEPAVGGGCWLWSISERRVGGRS